MSKALAKALQKASKQQKSSDSEVNSYESEDDSSESSGDKPVRKGGKARSGKAKKEQVWCALCRKKKCTIDNLKKHVKNCHPERFIGNENQPRTYWAAKSPNFSSDEKAIKMAT